jgi:hypothetical protein
MAVEYDKGSLETTRLLWHVRSAHRQAPLDRFKVEFEPVWTTDRNFSRC